MHDSAINMHGDEECSMVVMATVAAILNVAMTHKASRVMVQIGCACNPFTSLLGKCERDIYHRRRLPQGGHSHNLKANVRVIDPPFFCHF